MAEVRAPKPTVSLKTRLGHVNRMANTLTRVDKDLVARKLMKEGEHTLLESYSAEVIGTFNWLIDNEKDIVAWVGIPAEDRAAIAAHLDVAVAAARKAMEEANV